MSATDDTNAACRGSGSNDLLGPLVERLLRYSDIRRNDPRESREALRDLILGELRDELEAERRAERERCLAAAGELRRRLRGSARQLAGELEMRIQRGAFPSPHPMTDEIEYWRHFLTRVRFPREGVFFLVPDDCGPRSHVLVSADNPQRKLPVMLSGDETPETCAAMFTAALTVPGLRRAEVLLPNTPLTDAKRSV